MLPSRRTPGRRPSGWLLAIVLIGLAATATAGEEVSARGAGPEHGCGSWPADQLTESRQNHLMIG